LLLALEETIERLEVPPNRIMIFRQAPSQQGIVPRLLVRAVRKGDDPREVGKRLDRHEDERRIESRIFSSLEVKGVRTVDPAVVLCDSGLCRAAAGMYSAYYDDNHLSARGAMRLVPLIEAVAMESETAIW
jgi:hypothetical protein